MNTRVPPDSSQDYDWRQPLERVVPAAPPAPAPPPQSELEKDDWLPDGVRRSVNPPEPKPADDSYLD